MFFWNRSEHNGCATGQYGKCLKSTGGNDHGSQTHDEYYALYHVYYPIEPGRSGGDFGCYGSTHTCALYTPHHKSLDAWIASSDDQKSTVPE